VLVAKRLLDAVGAEAVHLAAHEEARLVQRVAERVAGIAKHDERPGLGHERRHMSDRALDHDVDASGRDAAAARGIAIDHEQTTAAGGTRRRGSVTFDVHPARHHVLGNAHSGAAIDDDIGALVHARAVIAGVAVDLDRDGGINAGSDGMPAAGIDDAEIGVIGPLCQIMQRLVEFAKGRDVQIDGRHQCRSQK